MGVGVRDRVVVVAVYLLVCIPLCSDMLIHLVQVCNTVLVFNENNFE